ncbi:Hypothetical protein KVN_LOCUS108 [uncultured virus]|nr:Hypothetical protein KVN_LOCUS108 [uncultured virus]
MSEIEEDIKDIVLLVFNKSFKIDIIPIKKTKKTEVVDDPEKEFKNIFTEIVTSKFLETNDIIVNFLKKVYTTFEKAINFYNILNNYKNDEIFFVYKGGNVLRIIAKESMNELPGRVYEVLNEHFGKSFQKSDADFSIYIKPDLPNFDQIIQEIKILSYLVLNFIRDQFLNNLPNYFDFFKYNYEEQKKILEKSLGNLNKSESIKNHENEYFGIEFLAVEFRNVFSALPLLDEKLFEIIKNDKLDIIKSGSGREDSGITQDPNDLDYHIMYKIPPLHMAKNIDPKFKEKLITPKKKNISEFYLTVNDTLKFKTAELIRSFYLLRMKLNFKTYFQKNGKVSSLNIPGEVIDVSISNKDGTGIKEFFESLEKNITVYSFEKENFKFRSYTIDYLIHDLEEIMYYQVLYPWEDPKYAKRINRLIYLYFIKLLMNKVQLDEKITYLYNLRSEIRTIQKLAKNKNKTIINQKLLEFSKKNKKFDDFDRLIKKIIRIVEIGFDETKFVDFLEIINTNINVLIDSLGVEKEYIKTQGRIYDKNIYDFSQFGGITKS